MPECCACRGSGPTRPLKFWASAPTRCAAGSDATATRCRSARRATTATTSWSSCRRCATRSPRPATSPRRSSWRVSGNRLRRAATACSPPSRPSTRTPPTGRSRRASRSARWSGPWRRCCCPRSRSSPNGKNLNGVRGRMKFPRFQRNSLSVMEGASIIRAPGAWAIASMRQVCWAPRVRRKTRPAGRRRPRRII